jgi:hypothetical protein
MMTSRVTVLRGGVWDALRFLLFRIWRLIKSYYFDIYLFIHTYYSYIHIFLEYIYIFRNRYNIIRHLSITMYPPPSTICHPGLSSHQCPCGRDSVGGQDVITFKHTINYRSKRCHLLILYQAFICVAIKNGLQWCGCIDHDSKNILCRRVSKSMCCQ